FTHIARRITSAKLWYDFNRANYKALFDLDD
ncbi:MAG: hypothetical protein ACI9U5_001689, partial [Colwellia sp.]